jgi:hypothetical protein
MTGECAATRSSELERQIMDSTVPKNEREWWAAREIERVREQASDMRQLLARAVMAAGGEVTVPLFGGPCNLIRQDRATPDVVVLTAARADITQMRQTP